MASTRAYRGRMEPEELAGAIKRLVEWAEGAAPQPEPLVRVRLREHFGCDPGELPVVSRPLEPWDRPNLQVALDAWLADKDSDIVGVGVMEGYRAGLIELVRGGPPAGAARRRRRRSSSRSPARVRSSRPTHYPTSMRKTSVYLTDADAERLARLSELEGRPQAAIIRDAIARYEQPAIGDRKFLMMGTGRGDGRSVADIPDEELYEGFGE